MMIIMPMQTMHLVKILNYFYETCIIIASLPSHSATSLGAVLLYVQCVCFPAGFGLFLCSGLFLFSRLLQIYGESGM